MECLNLEMLLARSASFEAERAREAALGSYFSFSSIALSNERDLEAAREIIAAFETAKKKKKCNL